MNANTLHDSASAAGIKVRIVKSQSIPAQIIPERSIASCPKCGAAWDVVTDRGGTTRRASDGPIKRRTWRLCPNRCNVDSLGH